jgi:hypothetical protein
MDQTHLHSPQSSLFTFRDFLKNSLFLDRVPGKPVTSDGTRSERAHQGMGGPERVHYAAIAC